MAKILAFGPLSIPRQERDDMEQEIMVDVWKAMGRPDFDVTRGFWGFVEVVTSRRCIDWLRRKRETVSLLPGLESEGTGPLQSVVQSERETLARRALSALKPPCQEVIALRFRDNLSYAQMAQVLGRSEGALRVQMYRCIGYARQALRALVEGGAAP